MSAASRLYGKRGKMDTHTIKHYIRLPLNQHEVPIGTRVHRAPDRNTHSTPPSAPSVCWLYSHRMHRFTRARRHVHIRSTDYHPRTYIPSRPTTSINRPLHDGYHLYRLSLGTRTHAPHMLSWRRI